MSSQANRRKNWTPEEIKVLFDTRESYAHVFSMPHNDVGYKAAITDAWSRIADEVNRVGEGDRSPGECKERFIRKRSLYKMKAEKQGRKNMFADSDNPYHSGVPTAEDLRAIDGLLDSLPGDGQNQSVAAEVSIETEKESGGESTHITTRMRSNQNNKIKSMLQMAKEEHEKKMKTYDEELRMKRHFYDEELRMKRRFYDEKTKAFQAKRAYYEMKLKTEFYVHK